LAFLEWRGLYLAWLAVIIVALLIVLRSATPRAEHAGHVVFRHGTVAIVLFRARIVRRLLGPLCVVCAIARGSGDRFMLSLYLPLVFSLIWGAEAIVRRIRRRHGSPWIIRGYLAAQWILSAAVAWRVIELLRLPKFYNG